MDADDYERLRGHLAVHEAILADLMKWQFPSTRQCVQETLSRLERETFGSTDTRGESMHEVVSRMLGYTTDTVFKHVNGPEALGSATST